MLRTRSAVSFGLLICLFAASAAQAGALQPTSLVYQGAFRLPTGRYSGDVDPSARETWNYGTNGLAYYPDGDAANADGGLTGSLFGACHAQIGWLGEVSIPEPVISATKTLSDLNTATQLQNFYNAGAAVTGLGYLPAQGSQSSGKLYSVTGAVNPNTANVRWHDTTLSAMNTQGPWNPATGDNRGAQGFVGEVPEDWATANVGGKRLLGGGGGLERYLGGCEVVAFGPWLDGNPPAPGNISDTILIKYNSTHLSNNFDEDDSWLGAAWLEGGPDSALVIFGKKDINNSGIFSDPDTPDYHAYALFYDPDDLAAVAAGGNTYDPQPFAVLDLEPYMFGTQHTIQATAYDSANHLLFVAEMYGDSPRPLIHVFSVVPEPATIALLGLGVGALVARRRRRR